MVGRRQLPTFVDRTSASRFYVKVAQGAHPDEVAQRLQSDLLPYGVQADTFRSLVDDRLSSQAQFIALLEGYLSLGLLIGIAGLGVVMVRAVRERRREIGMLRAMGSRSTVVRRSFMVEATFIAVQGILIGGVLGLVTGYSVLSKSSTSAASRFRSRFRGSRSARARRRRALRRIAARRRGTPASARPAASEPAVALRR